MADTKLSALTAATSIGATDEFYLNDSGTSKKCTLTTLTTAVVTGASVAAATVAATAKTTPVDADSLFLVDSEDSNAGKKVTLSQITDTLQAAKAFVSFVGTGTVTIRGTALNVSSITDNGTGDYTINFTTEFADANYTVLAFLSKGESDGASAFSHEVYLSHPDIATTDVRILSSNNSASFGTVAVDAGNCNIAIFHV